MRPSGKVKIGDQIYTARCESGFLEANVEIEVIAVTGGNLVVRELN
jgi:membrane protein implicated in regulation of membrane protease activity